MDKKLPNAPHNYIEFKNSMDKTVFTCKFKFWFTNMLGTNPIKVFVPGVPKASCAITLTTLLKHIIFLFDGELLQPRNTGSVSRDTLKEKHD